jgi:hypothetical protein
MLAETLTGIAGREPTASSIGNILRYDVNRSTVRRVLRLCEGIKLLSQIHSCYRRAGKGQTFHFSREDWRPHYEENLMDEAAIVLYDDRTEKNSHFLSRTGTRIAEPFDTKRRIDAQQDDSILCIGQIPERVLAPSVWQSKDGTKLNVVVRTGFLPQFIALDSLAQLNNMIEQEDEGLLWNEEVITLIFLLRMAQYLLFCGETAASKVQEYGYMVTVEQEFVSLVDDFSRHVSDFTRKIIAAAGPIPQNGKELLARLQSLEGSIWPLRPGKIVRRDFNCICIDLYGATALLDAALEYPRIAGRIGNVRGHHFEITVQKGIQTTAWALDEKLLGIRGRTIKINGADITDLDAIATKGKVLLLFSCKSLVYSAEYDRGDFNVVKAASDTATQAVDAWNSCIAIVKRYPRGDNFDFSAFQEIFGIVCTPRVLYVPISDSTKEVLPGLRACSSLSEIIEWLKKN